MEIPLVQIYLHCSGRVIKFMENSSYEIILSWEIVWNHAKLSNVVLIFLVGGGYSTYGSTWFDVLNNTKLYISKI